MRTGAPIRPVDGFALDAKAAARARAPLFFNSGADAPATAALTLAGVRAWCARTVVALEQAERRLLGVAMRVHLDLIADRLQELIADLRELDNAVRTGIAKP